MSSASRARRIPPADVEIAAAARARRLRFRSKPKTEVRTYARTRVRSETGLDEIEGEASSEGERRNLPDEVEPGVTYRDVEVGWAGRAGWSDPIGSRTGRTRGTTETGRRDPPAEALGRRSARVAFTTKPPGTGPSRSASVSSLRGWWRMPPRGPQRAGDLAECPTGHRAGFIRSSCVIDPLKRWHAYGEKPDYAGLLTFAGLPYTEDPVELAGADVVILGAPTDDLVSDRPGARFGPRAIRAASCSPGPHLETKIDGFAELRVLDYGDAAVLPADPARTHEAIERAVGEVLDAGAVPIVLGGDHGIAEPDIRACARRHGPIGLVHFDTHTDTGSEVFGVEVSHGTPMYRLVEQGHVDPQRYVQIGLRGYWPGEAEFAWQRDKGITSLFMHDVRDQGIVAVVEKAVEAAGEGPTFLLGGHRRPRSGLRAGHRHPGAGRHVNRASCCQPAVSWPRAWTSWAPTWSRSSRSASGPRTSPRSQQIGSSARSSPGSRSGGGATRSRRSGRIHGGSSSNLATRSGWSERHICIADNQGLAALLQGSSAPTP